MSTIEATFAKLIDEAYAAGASDVYLVPRQVPRIRVDRKLQPLGDTPLSPGDLEALALLLFDKSGIERQAREGSVQRRSPFTLAKGRGSRIMLRSTLAKTAGRYSISLRILAEGAHVSLELVCAPEVVKDLLVAPHGLIVVAGPHGSGKTTNLYAMVEWINENRPVHICTVEDPLDYELEPKQALLQQREVGTDVPDAPSGIAAALDQDVDVLMVASLNTLESLSAALHAAETGHLVLTQVHANTAEEALERIIEATPETMHALVRRSLSETLLGVTCQRLLPRHPRGRVPIYQVLLPDAGLRASIANGGPLSGFGAPGSVSMRDGVDALEAEGTISAETAATARAELSSPRG